MVKLHFGDNGLEVMDDGGSYRYRSMMGKPQLVLKFSLAEYVEIPLGAWCEWQGQRFELRYPVNIKKKGERNIEYTATLEDLVGGMADYKLRNFVDGRLKWSMCATPREFVSEIVANLNLRDGGVWKVGECIEAVERTVEFNHTSVDTALQSVAEAFETEWEVGDDYTVSLHKVEYFKDTPLPLSYGKGNGFVPGVGRSTLTGERPIKRLYVQGGERNIDLAAYGSATLLLPKGKTILYEGVEYVSDADGLFVERIGASVGEVREESLDCPDIYPSRVGNISSVECKDATKNFWDILDGGIPENLDYASYIIGGETMTVVFQSGMLAGKEFEVKYKHADRRFEIVPQDIDGVTMPNGTFKPEVGDKYAVFGVMLPPEYVCNDEDESGASWDMFREAVRHMHESREQKFTFTGELQGLWAKQRWADVGGRLKVGGYVLFSDNQFCPDGVPIRITGIKDYISDPYSPTIELSNTSSSKGSVSSQLRSISRQEVVIEDVKKTALQFTKRRFRDAREAIGMLEAAVDGFTEGVKPVSVSTMALLVGSEGSQFRFVDGMSNPAQVAYNIAYDNTEKKLSAPAGLLQHMTLGITSVSPGHADSEYRFWDVAAYDSVRLGDPAKRYYLYVKAAKGSDAAELTLSETALPLDGGGDCYHFLAGVLGSEEGGERSFEALYGFTEVLPGRIRADRVVSTDGDSYFDMASGAVKLGDALDFNSNGDGRLVLRGTVVQSQGGVAESPLGCFRGEYSDGAAYWPGDEVSYTAPGGTVSTYRRTGEGVSTGVAPTDATRWQPVALGAEGKPGRDGAAPRPNLLRGTAWREPRSAWWRDYGTYVWKTYGGDNPEGSAPAQVEGADGLPALRFTMEYTGSLAHYRCMVSQPLWVGADGGNLLPSGVAEVATLKRGRTYTLSWWQRAGNAAGVQVMVYPAAESGDNAGLLLDGGTYKEDGVVRQGAYPLAGAAATGEWERKTLEFTTPADAGWEGRLSHIIFQAYLMPRADYSSAVPWCELCGLKLETGEGATPWCEHVDDLKGEPGASGLPGNASFKSVVFMRSAVQPGTPSGGDWTNPVPAGWSDGVPAGEDVLWMSTRVFSSDGAAPQQGSWTVPAAVSNTADLDIVFSPAANPSDPSGHPNTNPQWSATATESSVWMAVSRKANGVWGAWQRSKIKGEDGEDGTSVRVRGAKGSVGELPTPPQDPSDCYTVGKDLWVWDGSAWRNAGRFVGEDGTSSYLHIKYANSAATNDWTAANGETPGAYIGICVSNEAADPADWNTYTWSKWRGEDGFGYEYVYKRTAGAAAPATPQGVSQQDGYVPQGWTADPSGVTDEWPYEWVCVRQRADGAWGAFKGSAADPGVAALWAGKPSSANPNLLLQTAFSSLDNMYKWAKADGLSLSGGVLGCKAASSDPDPESPSDQMLSQPVSLSTGQWYTLSFYAKAKPYLNFDINQTSDVYGFGTVELWLPKGMVGLTVRGGCDATLLQEGRFLAVYLYNDSWSYAAQLAITTQVQSVKGMELDIPEEGAYKITAFPYPSLSGGAGKASVSYYRVDRGGSFSAAVIRNVVDTSAKVYVDGVETAAPADGSVSWKPGGSFGRHTYTFKARTSSGSVVFTAGADSNGAYVSAPKLETGMQATAYMEASADLRQPYTEHRYAKNGSPTAPPPLSSTSTNPSGWVLTPPSLSAGEYLWMATARRKGDGSLDGQWSQPVRINPVDGKDGTPGKSPVMVFRGAYKAFETYYGTAERRDCVKVADGASAAYYIARVDAGAFKGSAPPDDGKWNAFGASFDSVATGLMLAEEANIGDWYLQGGKIVSALETTANRVVLDAAAGEVKAYTPATYTGGLGDRGKIVGINARSGVVYAQADAMPGGTTVAPGGISANYPYTPTQGDSSFANPNGLAALLADVGALQWQYGPAPTGAAFTAAVYGRCAKHPTAGIPAFGGYFVNLKAVGLVLNQRVVTDSDDNATLNSEDTYVICNNTAKDITLKLPTSPLPGCTLYIRATNRTAYLKSENALLRVGTGVPTTFTIEAGRLTTATYTNAAGVAGWLVNKQTY